MIWKCITFTILWTGKGNHWKYIRKCCKRIKIGFPFLEDIEIVSLNDLVGEIDFDIHITLPNSCKSKRNYFTKDLQTKLRRIQIIVVNFTANIYFFRVAFSSCYLDVWISSIALGSSNIPPQYKSKPSCRLELSNLAPAQYCPMSKGGLTRESSEHEQVTPFKVLLLPFLHEMSICVYSLFGYKAENILTQTENN